MEALLEIDNIEVVYNKAVQVLRGLSLRVPKGAIVALLGSNGAGKSTMFNLISGRMKVSDGSIKLFGNDIHNLPAHKVNPMAGCLPMLIQIPVFFALFTVSVEEKAPTQIGAEIAPITSDGAHSAKEATTDHAALQLQLRNQLSTFRAPMLFVSVSLCHI